MDVGRPQLGEHLREGQAGLGDGDGLVDPEPPGRDDADGRRGEGQHGHDRQVGGAGPGPHRGGDPVAGEFERARVEGQGSGPHRRGGCRRGDDPRGSGAERSEREQMDEDGGDDDLGDGAMVAGGAAAGGQHPPESEQTHRRDVRDEQGCSRFVGRPERHPQQASAADRGDCGGEGADGRRERDGDPVGVCGPGRGRQDRERDGRGGERHGTPGGGERREHAGCVRAEPGLGDEEVLLLEHGEEHECRGGRRPPARLARRRGPGDRRCRGWADPPAVPGGGQGGVAGDGHGGGGADGPDDDRRGEAERDPPTGLCQQAGGDASSIVGRVETAAFEAEQGGARGGRREDVHHGRGDGEQRRRRGRRGRDGHPDGDAGEGEVASSGARIEGVERLPGAETGRREVQQDVGTEEHAQLGELGWCEDPRCQQGEQEVADAGDPLRAGDADLGPERAGGGGAGGP